MQARQLDRGPEQTRLIGFLKPVPALLVGDAIAFRHERGQGLTEDLRFTVAEDGLRGAVSVHNFAVPIYRDNGVMGALRHGPVFFFRICQAPHQRRNQ